MITLKDKKKEKTMENSQTLFNNMNDITKDFFVPGCENVDAGNWIIMLIKRMLVEKAFTEKLSRRFYQAFVKKERDPGEILEFLTQNDWKEIYQESEYTAEQVDPEKFVSLYDKRIYLHDNAMLALWIFKNREIRLSLYTFEDKVMTKIDEFFQDFIITKIPTEKHSVYMLVARNDGLALESIGLGGVPFIAENYRP